MWLTVGDFAADNNSQLDVAVGVGWLLQVFVNNGPANAPLTAIPSATIYNAPADTLAFLAIALTPNAPTDLLAVNSTGHLTAWYNLVHSFFVNGAAALPSGVDLGVHLQGTGGGTITGTVWNNLDNSGAWDSKDPAWTGNGTTVYIDLNHDGKLDPGDPVATPSALGNTHSATCLPASSPTPCR